MKSKKKALYALGILFFLGVSLLLFVIAADEQSVLSSGLPTTDRMSLADFIAKGSGKNQHIELTDFYFGKPYLYAAKLVQFKEVYVSLFPTGKPENAGNLHLLLWIRNDRNSNERLIQSEQDLDRFMADFRRNRRSVTGVLRRPIERVRKLTAEAYPEADVQSLQVLWAREFPDQQSTNVLWILGGLCFVAAGVCAFAYKRFGEKSEDVEMELHLTPPEAASGKEFHVSVPERTEIITVNVPPGAQDGARLRLRGMGRLGKNGKSKGDLYIRLRVTRSMPQPTFRLTVEEVFYIKPPVDRVILVGTVQDGTVKAGDAATVECAAGSVSVTVEGIEAFKQGDVKQASKGEQVGLKLRGITKDQPSKGDQVSGKRGG